MLPIRDPVDCVPDGAQRVKHWLHAGKPRTMRRGHVDLALPVTTRYLAVL